jgi:hypothetical protein
VPFPPFSLGGSHVRKQKIYLEPPNPKAQADVEGYEPGVLRGSKRLFLDHTVQHMFMEYSPGVAERAHNWYWFEDNPVVLLG